MKVLLSAYACEPRKGSEPGVGWNMARALARHHDVWVLTRANNRRAIERELAGAAGEGPPPRFVYYDLPRWARWWKRKTRGVQLYYYLWQIGAYRVARRLHRAVGFDLAHHATFGKYWAPSVLALLRVPFIWGPVGGAESAPKAFWGYFSLRGKVHECLRDLGRWLGERDPFVRLTARRSALVLAITEQTAARCARLGAGDVRLFSEIGLPAAEIDALARCAAPAAAPVRFISVGQLLHLKAFHLGLRAFARAGLPDAEYWIVGDGPERRRLQDLAQALGCADRVRFWGWLPRHETLCRVAESHILVHPTLHDSGGYTSVEAMAAGRPVICFDLPGPGTQVPPEAGVKVCPRAPEQAVRDLADAMRRLAVDPELRRRMGDAGRRRSASAYRWESQVQLLDDMYRQVVHTAASGGPPGVPNASGVGGTRGGNRLADTVGGEG